jgi:hypothetical protein
MRLGVLVCVALALAACGGSGESEPDARTTTAVYAAIVRMFMTSSSLVSPPAPVFVAESKLTPAQQAAVNRALADLPPPVEFVADRESVLVDLDTCPAVRDNGVVITLGPITGDSERVTVPADLFAACLGAETGIFILERDGEDWRITGTEGPIGVS